VGVFTRGIGVPLSAVISAISTAAVAAKVGRGGFLTAVQLAKNSPIINNKKPTKRGRSQNDISFTITYLEFEFSYRRAL
jgi:hypothetical protein